MGDYETWCYIFTASKCGWWKFVINLNHVDANIVSVDRRTASVKKHGYMQ
jgi:hypothetical protein